MGPIQRDKEIDERVVLLLGDLADEQGEVDVPEWREAFGGPTSDRFKKLSRRVIVNGLATRISLKRVKITPTGMNRINEFRKVKQERIRARLESARSSSVDV